MMLAVVLNPAIWADAGKAESWAIGDPRMMVLVVVEGKLKV
jgi:hypothetical protein